MSQPSPFQAAVERWCLDLRQVPQQQRPEHLRDSQRDYALAAPRSAR